MLDLLSQVIKKSPIGVYMDYIKYAFIALIVILIAYAGYVGYKTIHDTFEQNKQLTVQLSKAQQDIIDLKTSLAQTSATAAISVADVSTNFKSQLIAIKDQGTILDKRNKTLETIKVNYQQPKTTAEGSVTLKMTAQLSQQEIAEISGAEITAVWDAYCKAVPSAPQPDCKATEPVKSSLNTILDDYGYNPIIEKNYQITKASNQEQFVLTAT